MTPDEFFSEIRQVVKDEIQKHNEAVAKEKLLSPEVARKLFHPEVSKQTLHRWTKEGMIPVYRLGGRIWYKESEVTEAAKTIKKYKHSL